MRILLILPCLIFYSFAFSQTHDQLSDTIGKELEQVVITGQYKPQSLKNSVYQVRSISRDRIQKQGATKLQDVLKNELNIRFAQDMATGGSGITMNGLPGQNLKILVDGLPVTGRQGISNEIDINQLDINSIERIEIVEGPMSVVFGADALAGVINIITRKATVSGFSVHARIVEETVGSEYGIKQGIHNQYAGLSWKKKYWDIGGAFGRNYFGGWKDTAIGRELLWHKKDQIIGNATIGFKKEKLSIRYRFDGLDEIITNPGNYNTEADPNTGQVLAYDQEYLSQRVMQQIQASYLASNNLNFQIQTAHTFYSRQVFSTTVNKETGDTRLDPGTGRQSVVDFSGFTFRSTAYIKLSGIVSLQPGIDINLDRGIGERLKAGSNAVDDYAFFISSEITPNANINIRPGVRIIRNSVYDAPPLIPSINVRIGLAKELDLRLSYARGFRAPSLRELYFNFVDASHLVIGNPDLKAETSHSLNGSLNLKHVSSKNLVHNTILAGFFNRVNNLIDYAFSASSDTAVLVNIDRSKTAGTSITHSVTGKRWNIQSGLAYTGFYNALSVVNKDLPDLQWTAEVNAVAGYNFPKLRMDLNVFYKFTGRRPQYVTSGPDIILAETSGYHLADITAGKKLFKNFILTGGIRNLFDAARIRSSFATGGIHTAGGLNVGTGRSYFAGFAFNWDKNQ